MLNPPPPTPDLLRTLFVSDDRDRIATPPSPTPALMFCLVRGDETCVWAAGADVPDNIAAELDALARDEPPAADPRQPPVHAERYAALLGGRVSSGPAFSFPDALPDPGDVVSLHDVRPLEHHFRGWVAEEIPGCLPIVAVLEDGHAVSACFCARRSDASGSSRLVLNPPRPPRPPQELVHTPRTEWRVR